MIGLCQIFRCCLEFYGYINFVDYFVDICFDYVGVENFICFGVCQDFYEVVCCVIGVCVGICLKGEFFFFVFLAVFFEFVFCQFNGCNFGCGIDYVGNNVVIDVFGFVGDVFGIGYVFIFGFVGKYGIMCVIINDLDVFC